MAKRKKKAERVPTRTPEQVAGMSDSEKLRVLKFLDEEIDSAKYKLACQRASTKDLVKELEAQKAEILEPVVAATSIASVNDHINRNDRANDIVRLIQKPGQTEEDVQTILNNVEEEDPHLFALVKDRLDGNRATVALGGTPAYLEHEAETSAEFIMGLSTGDRLTRLKELRDENPTLHALVLSKLGLPSSDETAENGVPDENTDGHQGSDGDSDDDK